MDLHVPTPSSSDNLYELVDSPPPLPPAPPPLGAADGPPPLPPAASAPAPATAGEAAPRKGFGRFWGRPAAPKAPAPAPSGSATPREGAETAVEVPAGRDGGDVAEGSARAEG